MEAPPPVPPHDVLDLPRRGPTFVILPPVMSSSRHEVVAMDDQDITEQATGSTTRHAVLIVDDEVTFRRSLAEGISLLSGERYQPVCVGSVDQAMALLRNRQFAALVTDIRMPGKDGLQLLLEMKRQSIRVPTLVTTAYGSPAVHAQAARSGAVRYIEKPFPLEHLMGFLDTVTSGAGSGRVRTLDLIEVVEMLCMGGRDIRVGVRTRDVQGSIYIKGGEIVHASIGDRAGADVLLELLALPQPQVSTDPGEEAPEITIEQAWRDLTEEAWRSRTVAAPSRAMAAPEETCTQMEDKEPVGKQAEEPSGESPATEPVSADENPQEEAEPAGHPLSPTRSFWVDVASSDLAARMGATLGLIRTPAPIRLDDAHEASTRLVIEGSTRVGIALGAGAFLGCAVKTLDATMVYAPTDELTVLEAICVAPSLPERRLYLLAKALRPSGLEAANSSRWASRVEEGRHGEGGTRGTT